MSKRDELEELVIATPPGPLGDTGSVVQPGPGDVEDHAAVAGADAVVVADGLNGEQEIERRVQGRAKDTSLDMAGDDGKAKLRRLIADEVTAWSDAYKRGLRAFDLADPELVAERAYRNLAGYGPLEPLLADDDVWEIMVNSPDGVFIEP